MKSRALGRHILVEFMGCQPEVLNDVATIERALTQAARIAGATIVDVSFHAFSPHGVSGVVVIQESHLAIHTWPEYGYAAVDLFTCSDQMDPWDSFDYLKALLGAQNHSTLELQRGSLALLARSSVPTDRATSDFAPSTSTAPPIEPAHSCLERSVPREPGSRFSAETKASSVDCTERTWAPPSAEVSAEPSNP
jgi:spermidine synthase